MKDVHYRRVSVEEQASKGTSMENQAEKLAAFSLAHAAEIVADYADPGFTGRDGDRPGLRRLLEDASQGQFDRVVVLRLDRLARKLRLLLDVEEQLRNKGIALLSVTESLDTSTLIGRLIFQILGVVAEWERETIIERTRSGRMQRYQEGRWGPGNPPYGYDYDAATKRLVVNEDEAPVVKRAFELYTHGGKSLSKIADILNSEGAPPRSASRKTGRATVWHKTGVRDILKHPVYKGVHPVHNGKAEVPAIVTAEIWEAGRRKLREGRHVRAPRINPWLFQGRLRCGLCGHYLRSELSHGQRFYSCRGRLREHHRDGSPACTLFRISAPWLEKQLMDRMKGVMENPAVLGDLLDKAIADLKNREAELEAIIRPVEDQLAAIRQKRTKLAESWVAGTLGADRVARERDKLDREEERLRAISAQVDPDQLKQLALTRSHIDAWQDARHHIERGGKLADAWMWVLGRPIKPTVVTEGGHLPYGWQEEDGRLEDWRELLSKLEAELWAFSDRVEVNALFSIETVRRQKAEPGCR